MTQLPVQPAWGLADTPEQRRWLVDELWSEEAVGIIGGEPKCCKSFLALDLAVAVAAGTPCLRRFAVARHGRVLLYPAEDALSSAAASRASALPPAPASPNSTSRSSPHPTCASISRPTARVSTKPSPRSSRSS